jgi:hypothetical protein
MGRHPERPAEKAVRLRDRAVLDHEGDAAATAPRVPATITYQTRLSYGGDEFLVELRSFGRYTSLQVTIATERKKKGLWAPPFFIEGWRDKKTPNLRLLATTLANKIRGKMFADIHVGDDP